MIQPMTEDTLRQAVKDAIARAEDYIAQKIDPERSVAYDLYYGRLFGDEVEGQSKVVSHEVAQAIDSSVPGMVKMFAGSDRVVECMPRGAEDVQDAEDATETVNYVFWGQNNGYLLLHDCIKDGLLVKTGIFKWRWEEKQETVEETLQGLDDEQLAMVAEQGEIIAHTSAHDGFSSRHDVTIRKVKPVGIVRVDVVAPEDFLIDPESHTPLVSESPFVCHKPLKFIDELVEMGYDRALLETATADDSGLGSELSTSRWVRTNSQQMSDAEESKKRVRYYECYIDIDFDGDGIQEKRKVCMVGEKILHNEPVDHVPISMWTPKLMPHEPIGMSMADDIGDMQVLSTVLWRQILNNLYLVNTPQRVIIEGQVNLDDVLHPRAGGVIRAQSMDSIRTEAIPFTAAQSFQMLEYVQQAVEVRTGASRYSQGLDPNTLNKTATGITALMNAASVRMEMYARNFGELALKPLMRGILYLLAKNKQDELVARLRNKPGAVINPEVWAKEYDLTVNVGLGTGTKDQQMMHLTNITGLQMQMAQSPYASLVPPKQVYNTVAKLTEVAGFRDPAQFWRNPEEPPKVDEQGQPTEQPWPPEQGPPPEIQKAQMQIEADQQKFQAQSQMDQQKFQAQSQLDQQKMVQEQQAAQQQAILDAQVERFKAELQAQTQIQIEQIKAQFEHERECKRIEQDGVFRAREVLTQRQ